MLTFNEKERGTEYEKERTPSHAAYMWALTQYWSFINKEK